MVAVTRFYKNAPAHLIPAGVSNASTTSITVDSVVGWPTQFPFGAVIEPDTALEEAVDVNNVVGLVLTVTRGVDGTTASAHAAGSVIAHAFLARDAQEANEHIMDSTDVHGTTGAVVGVGGTQTISGNKTFSGGTTHSGTTNLNGTNQIGGVTTFNAGVFLDGLPLRNVDPTVDVFTAGGTWTKPGGLKYVEVEVQAGGGGAGGAGTTGAGQGAAGGGGGGGGYTRETILASALGATETVTVGAGGAGASVVGGAGLAGGSSSFGSLCSATGGGGGAGMGAVTNSNAAGGAGGTGTGGNVNISGQDGGTARVGAGEPHPSVGGMSVLGSGAAAGVGTNTSVGQVGVLYGGGGSGGFVRASTAGVLGSAGAGGIVVVRNYF